MESQFIRPQAPDWNNIQAAKCIEQAQKIELEEGVALSISSDQGSLILTQQEHSIRIRSDLARSIDYPSLAKAPLNVDFDLVNMDGGCELRNPQRLVKINFDPFAIEVLNSDAKTLCRSSEDGHFVRRFRVPPLAKTDDGWFFSFDLQSGEPIYGLGEKWAGLNKRGQLLRSYNSDALGVNAEISYKNVPFCWSPEGWGVFLNTPAPVTHSLGYPAWSQRSYCAFLEDSHLDIFILLADPNQTENSAAELIRTYSDITGYAPPPPTWSGGVILSKAYYQTAEEILQAAREVRRLGMPCDVITFDGRAWQDTDTRFSFTWDESRYPDPKPVIDELKQLGFKVCVWEYPLISVENDWFTEFSEKGWLLKDQDSGQAYQFDWDRQAFGEVLTNLPRSGIVDFTHPDAYAFWLEAHKPLFDLGVDMIKADFGEQIEDHVVAHNGEKGLALHNVYSFLYNQCVYEAAEKYSPSGPFLFSRASWIGCQRFNSQWGGDPQADWEGMMANLRGGLSWGLSGAPFYATDVGGFYKDTRDDDLYVRWAQAAVFSAHYRLHGIGAREPWSYSEKANSAVMAALSLRYRLQRYLQVAMHQACETGMPVQRPMVLAFPNDKAAWGFENQFMFGDDILFAPCFKPSGEVEFYLPEGQWQQFRLDGIESVKLAGGRTHAMTLDLNEIAAFVLLDRRIALNKDVKNTNELVIEDDGLFEIEEYWPVART